MTENIVQSVRISVTVSPDGKVQDCITDVSSGNPQLDRHTCSVVRRRANFRPAIDSNGNRVFGIYRTSINWWVGDGYPPSRPNLPDIEVTVSSLPPKVKSPAFLRLKFAVDELGNPSACTAEDNQADPQLAAAGCEQLKKLYTPRPAMNPKGIAVPSVQSGAVLFRTN